LIIYGCVLPYKTYTIFDMMLCREYLSDFKADHIFGRLMSGLTSITIIKN